MSHALLAVLAAFNILVLTYFVLLNTAYAATTVAAFRGLRRHARRTRSTDLVELMTTAGAPPITLIAPAFNEEATCVDSVRALLSLQYPVYDVIVVNDGSRDDTLDRLTSAYELVPAARVPIATLPTMPIRNVLRSRRHPNLWVLDKQNGGKADALNAGLNYCRTPLFCAMDADTLLEPDALLRVTQPFLDDRHTVALGGIIRIVNGCEVRHGRVVDVRLPARLPARLQVLEYLRAFLSGRMGWDEMDAMLIISGAFGVFRRPAVVEAGGFATDTVGEDMELVVRLHRHFRERRAPYRIGFVPDPVAWTECPETLSVLGRQRDRWQRGLAQTLLRHRRMLLNPKYGRIGLLAYPYFFFLEMLGPFIEMAGYLTFTLALVLGTVDAPFAIAFLAMAFVFGIAISIAAVALEELTFQRYHRFGDLLRLFALSVIENIGYRQLNAYWRMRGMLRLRRTEWGAMQRLGFRPTIPRP